MISIDLNCDVGEGMGLEPELLPLVSSANIACGAHAGDADTMRTTMELARGLGVRVGAHPGFADREHFGRRDIALPPREIESLVTGQLKSLAAYGDFAYVKPHGALYNMAARDADVAGAVVKAVKRFDPRLVMLGLAGSTLLDVAADAGLATAREAFADRGYDDDGQLMPRGTPGALITDETAAVGQVLSLVRDGRVRSVAGKWVAVAADSICLHGDNRHAVAFARRLRHELGEADITVLPFAGGQ